MAKSETLDVGLYVDGKISIRAYDFEINIVGDEPNLVANLLNEGNTDALFTTAEMIPSSSTKTANSTFISNDGNKKDNNTAGNLVDEYPPLQYLGDLAENSPLPVSIPLKIPNNTSPGNYHVFIKISYKDNLRNNHNLVVNGTVNYSPQIESSSSDTGLFLGFINPVILLVLLLVIIIIIYFIIRRFRKRKKDKRMKSSMSSDNSENELDSVLGDSD
jgi:cbb3-type cytochrome oxidase subunit 3